MKTPVTDAATFETDSGHSVVLAEVSAGIESSRNELLAALEDIMEAFGCGSEELTSEKLYDAMRDFSVSESTKRKALATIRGRASIANARKIGQGKEEG